MAIKFGELFLDGEFNLKAKPGHVDICVIVNKSCGQGSVTKLNDHTILCVSTGPKPIFFPLQTQFNLIIKDRNSVCVCAFVVLIFSGSFHLINTLQVYC